MTMWKTTRTTATTNGSTLVRSVRGSVSCKVTQRFFSEQLDGCGTVVAWETNSATYDEHRNIETHFDNFLELSTARFSALDRSESVQSLACSPVELEGGVWLTTGGAVAETLLGPEFGAKKWRTGKGIGVRPDTSFLSAIARRAAA